MRENYLAFVVRPAGPSWELFVLATPCGVDRDQFDVLRGRVPHDRDPDEVIRRDAARYGLTLGERLATLGDEPLLETRRRTAYLYRAADNFPVSWTTRIEPDKPPRVAGVTLPDIVGHFRFVDLAQPIPIGASEAVWLDRVRQAVGLKPLPPATLAIWATDDPSADPAAAAEALRAGRQPPASRPVDVAKLAKHVRGWTSANPEFLALRRVGPNRTPGFGLLVHLRRDGVTFTSARAGVITQAGEHGCHTFDATTARLYRPNESPAPFGTPTLPNQLLEVPFTRELLAELAHRGGPLMLWPRTPPIDEAGEQDDYRDDALPYALWGLPANQRVIVDKELSGYFGSNDGLICPLVDDLGPLHEIETRRITHHSGGAVTIYSCEDAPGWDQLVDHLGWAYLPNGPDALWGDLHVSPRRLPLLEAVRDWCLRNGVEWARYESRNGEVVRVVENARQR